MPLTSFQQIQQLVALLSKLVRGKPEIVTPSRKAGETLQDRFLALISHEEEAVASALGTATDKSSYQFLKSTILRRLLNSLFLIDLKKSGKYSPLAIARVDNDRNLFICKTLSFFGLKDTSEQISRREFPVAEEFELSANAIEYLNVLINGATTGSDESKLRFYRERQLKWLRTYRAEIEISGSQSELLIKFAKRGSENPGVRDTVFSLAFDAEQAYKTHGTFKLGLAYYRLKGIAYQVVGNYKECLEVCEAAEAFIKSKPNFATTTRIAEFAIKRLVCSIHLRDGEKGLTASQTCLTAYQVGSYNWFVTMEYLFLLHMITLDFDSASVILHDTRSHNQYESLGDFIKERWSLYELYLLYAQGRLSRSHKLKFRKEVEVRDFLQWTPSYSADKAGFNMSVLILHILYLVDAKDFVAISERIDALEAYRSRYLRGKNKQADIFLQLLARLVKAGSKHREVARETSEFAKELHINIDGKPIAEGVQILPFEWLWERIMLALPKS